MKQIYYVLTEKCNLNCVHCIRGEQNFESMDTTYAIDGLKKLSYIYPDCTLVLTGGEPTLHEEFDKILKCALDMYKKVIITTNGTTKYFDKVDLNDYKKKINFQISIDGDEVSHDDIRGKGNFSKSIVAAESLVIKGYNVTIATTVTNEKVFSLKPLFEKLISINIKKWYINNELPFGNAMSSSNKPLDRISWNKLVELVKINCTKLCVNIKPLYNLEDCKYLNCSNLTIKSKNCGSGRDKIYIYPNFDVYGCTCLKDLCFGNLIHDSIEHIMQSENAELILNYKVASDSICSKCKFIDICNGGCIGMSLHSFKKLGYGDIRCPLVSKGEVYNDL